MSFRSPLASASSSMRSLLVPSTTIGGGRTSSLPRLASCFARSYSDRPPTGPVPPHASSSSSPSSFTSSSSPSSQSSLDTDPFTTPRPSTTTGSTSSSFSSPSSSSSSSSSDSETHFGFRTIPASSKETLVGSVFSSVASKYDVMNDAMSLGIHRLWKDHFVSKLDPRGGIRVLDVAGGTGDIALRILDHARTRHADRETSVTVLDINAAMLVEGQKRFKQTMYWNTPQVSFQLGNAELLDGSMVPPAVPPRGPNSAAPLVPPLVSRRIEDASIDLYTIAFGIRNCTHIDQVLRQAYRVLKPGGVFACLEFGKVRVPLLAQLYRQYSFNCIPPLGQLLAGDRASYQYLIESIERFPTQPAFARMIQQAGFQLPGSPAAASLGFTREGAAAVSPGDEDVAGGWEDLSLGIASVWIGVKV